MRAERRERREEKKHFESGKRRFICNYFNVVIEQGGGQWEMEAQTGSQSG